MSEGERQHHYYEWTGVSHHDLLRCTECQRLVPYGVLKRVGACPRCGTRRVKEIKTLTGLEWLRIRLGLIRFRDRDKFLAEFTRVRNLRAPAVELANTPMPAEPVADWTDEETVEEWEAHEWD